MFTPHIHLRDEVLRPLDKQLFEQMLVRLAGAMYDRIHVYLLTAFERQLNLTLSKQLEDQVLADSLPHVSLIAHSPNSVLFEFAAANYLAASSTTSTKVWSRFSDSLSSPLRASLIAFNDEVLEQLNLDAGGVADV